ncbi:hypothetical protein [Paraburkholderia sp. A3RO-2L]|jgi:hypothetical protein|uniref:hypothetical protein n=1 Tax=unclassified Paraburkholderia TaxID=2615204 RepID=UPI003DA86192
MANLNPKLDHPAYHAAIRLPKYNGAVTVLQAVSTTDAARVLRANHPEWTQADHYQLASLHATEAAKQEMRYSKLLDAAAHETFGRPFAVTDYHISAIGSELFSEEKKVELRQAAYAKSNHKAIAMAHLQAARARRIAV